MKERRGCRKLMLYTVKGFVELDVEVLGMVISRLGVIFKLYACNSVRRGLFVASIVRHHSCKQKVAAVTVLYCTQNKASRGTSDRTWRSRQRQNV